MLNKEKKIWLITDTHLGHDAMVQYCGRPQNHSDLILAALKRSLLDGDILIHLGDICIGNDTLWHARFNESLPNIRKILIRGNHDKRSNSWYMRHGWDFVCERFDDTLFGEHITFSHIPVAGIENWNIHGHFHNNLPRLQAKKWVTPDEEERNKDVLEGLNENHKLLAIENTQYAPVLLRKFIGK